MAPGDHGSTFAGNPLVCHAANAVVDVISDPAFLSGEQPANQSAFGWKGREVGVTYPIAVNTNIVPATLHLEPKWRNRNGTKNEASSPGKGRG
jgi:hypothetical protein